MGFGNGSLLLIKGLVSAHVYLFFFFAHLVFVRCVECT